MKPIMQISVCVRQGYRDCGLDIATYWTATRTSSGSLTLRDGHLHFLPHIYVFERGYVFYGISQFTLFVC